LVDDAGELGENAGEPFLWERKGFPRTPSQRNLSETADAVSLWVVPKVFVVVESIKYPVIAVIAIITNRSFSYSSSEGRGK
jgi:hypothetical protein